MSACAHRWAASGTWDGPTDSGCSAPVRLTCRDCGESVGARCQTSRASKCRECARSYRGRVAKVGHSGMVTGVRGLFITLTAPGADVHYLPNGDPCPCTPPGGVDLATWNATAVARWNRLLRDLGRAIGAHTWEYVEREVLDKYSGTYDTRRYRREVSHLSYFRGTEPQKRGALHFHVMLRRTDGQPLQLRAATLRRLAIKHGFGHSVDVQRLEPGHAAYVAKYVAKSADDRSGVRWPSVVTRRRRSTRWPTEGQMETVAVFQKRPGFRTWVASRTWGRSMADVRAAQAHHVAVLTALPDWTGVVVPRAWSRLVVPDHPDLPPHAPPPDDVTNSLWLVA